MSNSQIYTGSTSNLRRRIAEHNSAKTATTRKYLPVTLLGYEAYSLKSDATRREKFLKSTEGKRLLRQQYRDIILQLSQDNLRAHSSAGYRIIRYGHVG